MHSERLEFYNKTLENWCFLGYKIGKTSFNPEQSLGRRTDENGEDIEHICLKVHNLSFKLMVLQSIALMNPLI